VSNPTPEQFSELRKHYFDGGDQIMRGLSIGGSPRSGNRIRAVNPPEWAVNNDLLREVLLRAFPKLETNETQYRRAILWVEIIHRFFRCGHPASLVAMELFSEEGLAKRPWLRASSNPEKYVENTVRRMRRIAAGLRGTGKPRRGARGRPTHIKFALKLMEPLPFLPLESGDTIFNL